MGKKNSTNNNSLQSTSLTVYINSELMGKGDDELGKVLMGAYMETLTNFAGQITHIMLVNSGVKLACEGSAVLDLMKELEGMDIEILSCGTCLNFFDIKDSLSVGVVSNMFTIVDVLSRSDKILSP